VSRQRRRAHPEIATNRVSPNGTSASDQLCVSLSTVGGVVVSAGGVVVVSGGGAVVVVSVGDVEVSVGCVVVVSVGDVVVSVGCVVVVSVGDVVVSVGDVVVSVGDVVVSVGDVVVVSAGGGVVSAGGVVVSGGGVLVSAGGVVVSGGGVVVSGGGVLVSGGGLGLPVEWGTGSSLRPGSSDGDGLGSGSGSGLGVGSDAGEGIGGGRETSLSSMMSSNSAMRRSCVSDGRVGQSSVNVSASAWSKVVTLIPAASAAARSSINAEAISMICSGVASVTADSSWSSDSQAATRCARPTTVGTSVGVDMSRAITSARAMIEATASP
jgi:hypothetical protein